MNPVSNQLTIRCLPTFLFAVLPFSAAFGGAVPATLNPEEQKIVAYVDAHRDEFAKDLEKAVQIDSATENHAGVKQMAAYFVPLYQALGFDARFVPLPESTKRAGHFLATRSGTRGKRVLLIGHLDTVLPGGNFRREGDKVFGAGTFDMKGGDLVFLHALRALHNIGALEGTALNVIMTGDEEDPGRPFATSRRELHDLAARSDLALAFEFAVGNTVTVGATVTIGTTVTVARRGMVRWALDVQGNPGHSSKIFSAEVGAGSVNEAARILAAFYEQLHTRDGITCNPVLFPEGPGKINAIPPHTHVAGDLRFLNADDLAAAKTLMEATVEKSLPLTKAKLHFADDFFPAMAGTRANDALLAQLDQVSRDLGFGGVQPCDPKVRGAGDISFISPPLPGLDGLGLRGEGAHALGEFAYLDTAPELIKRTAVLIYRLTR